jgi:hypothetical protein
VQSGLLARTGIDQPLDVATAQVSVPILTDERHLVVDHEHADRLPA